MKDYISMKYRAFATVDEHGNPVKRTKQEYPYSYDGFVCWRGGSNSEVNASVYHDRMQQWDYEKYQRCSKKQGDPGLMRDKNPTQIEAFLREYMDDDKLRLIIIMEYCNMSSGYPVWRFDYNTSK